MIEVFHQVPWYSIWPSIILYAEIHFRIPGIPSRLFQRWPEILADAPIRVEPNQKIPVLLLVKDAHRFPVTIEQVWIEFSGKNQCEKRIKLLQNPIFISTSWWERMVEIEIPRCPSGEAIFDLFFQVRRKNKVRIIKNDNYLVSSRRSFRVKIARDQYPLFPNQYAGDLHIHSNYTSDQVEFGASLAAIQRMGRAVALSFVAVCDHSYDLDDLSNNYTRRDPGLTKWRNLQQEIADLNQRGESFWFIPGEEVSVANSRGRNIHFLLINCRQFYPGTGDSGEKWFRTRAEWSLESLLQQIPEESLAVVPHPFARMPKLEYIFLRRGKLNYRDLSHSRLNGLQIWNGIRNPAFYRGLKFWKRLLLEGKKVLIYSGNDAHGNFNYYRQIRFPFWSMVEKDYYVFGRTRTVVCLQSQPDLPTILQALRRGCCYVTDGPALSFEVIDTEQNPHFIGEEVHLDQGVAHLDVLSTAEFGLIQKIRIYSGRINQKEERIYREYRNIQRYSHSLQMPILAAFPSYLRIEVETTKGHQAYSNPIWFATESQ